MITSSKTSPLSSISGETVQTEPTFTGILETTLDALILFEAARKGVVPRVCRRLAEDERSVIKSGSIFIFEEQESGIKRWTDGLIWSPSRISGNYLIYRQTDVREARSARTKSTSAESSKTNNFSISDPSTDETLPFVHSSVNSVYHPHSQNFPTGKVDRARRPSSSSGTACKKDGESEEVGMYADMLGGIELARAKEKQLIGSLSNSYCAKPGGLVKKTMALNIDGRTHHLISYYSVADGMARKFRTPSSVPELLALGLSPDLLAKEKLRFAPQTELGLDGTLRYVAEADVTSPTSGLSFSAPNYPPKTSATYSKDQFPKNRQLGFMPLPPVPYQPYPISRPPQSAHEPDGATWSSSLSDIDSYRRGSISKIFSETQLDPNSSSNLNSNSSRSHRNLPNVWPARSLSGDATTSAGRQRSTIRLPSSPDSSWKHQSNQTAKMHHHPYAPSSPNMLDNGSRSFSFGSNRTSPAVHPEAKKRTGYLEMTAEPSSFTGGSFQEHNTSLSSLAQHEPIWMTKREPASEKRQNMPQLQPYQDSSLHQHHYSGYQEESAVPPPIALSAAYPLPIVPGDTDEPAFLFESSSLTNGPASFDQHHRHRQHSDTGHLFSSQGEIEHRRQSTCPSLSSVSVGTTLPSDSSFSPFDPSLFHSDLPTFRHQQHQLHQPSWGLGLNPGRMTAETGSVPYTLPSSLSSPEHPSLGDQMPTSFLVTASQPGVSHSYSSQHSNLTTDSPLPIQNEISSTSPHMYPLPPSYNSESPLRSYQSSLAMAHSHRMSSPIKSGPDSFSQPSLLLGPEVATEIDDQGFDQIEFTGYEQIQKNRMKTILPLSTLEGSEGTERTAESGVWAQ